MTAVGDIFSPAGTRATPERSSRAVSQERLRWRMTIEARVLLVITAVLLVFGLTTLYSASAIVAVQEGRPSWFFLYRQLTGVAAGIVALAVLAKWDAERWRDYAWPLMALAFATMLMTVLPGPFERLAPPINGSRRFLLGGSIQPSEFAKLAVVIWTAMLIVKKGGAEGLRRLTKGLMPFGIILVGLSILCALQPDFSVVLFYALVMGAMLFAAGARIGHFVFLGALALPIVWSEINRLEYIMRRLLGFTGAAGAEAEINYQLNQSLIAVGSGGLWGLGFGQGRQQYGFLPLPYNDFIGSNIGEEWGFVGMFGVILLFALWAWLGFRIAKQARTPFTQLVALGITITTVVTAYLHIGVVIGLLPTTGLTLPFISYGRSNILLTLVTTGILLNIGSVAERVVGDRATDPLAARR
ncbi:MAG: cell division protein FtsW [Gemmatimonadaceae bacterium]|nr:cell division protein FtsW [Gemmatimonadaceae bacterium]MCW5824952.1 cell division protein FtsW [Gemmatimonadaceae bacterium]